MNDNEESEDLKGGPGHIVLPAVVFAVPVLKLVWTLGGGGEASEALVAMEPSKLVVGAFHGLWWGGHGGPCLVRAASRCDRRVPHRERGSGRRARTSPSGRLQRGADTAWVAAVLPAGVVLPVIALIGAVDGRSWTNVVTCDVNTGRGLVELGRKGNGVVGWDIKGDEVVNGVNCGVLEDDVVRAPRWRS
ncbi:hypothetical protein OH786_01450 [Streptomyces atratus]|uniref:hypothetical protein n=1 Tax=Streptomyces atratus TaxID=1893 RepID=UPI003248067C